MDTTRHGLSIGIERVGQDFLFILNPPMLLWHG